MLRAVTSNVGLLQHVEEEFHARLLQVAVCKIPEGPAGAMILAQMWQLVADSRVRQGPLVS